MSKSEILGSVITVLSFCITVGTLGAKLVSLLEKLKNKLEFLREELQETQIETRERLDSLDGRLRDMERQLTASVCRERETPYYSDGEYSPYRRFRDGRGHESRSCRESPSQETI